MSQSKDNRRNKGNSADLFQSKDAQADLARKKQTRTAVIVLAIIAIVSVVVLILNSNFFYRSVTALEVDGQRFSIADMNFFASQAGFSHEASVAQATESAMLYNRARAAGLSISEEHQTMVDSTLAFVDENYRAEGFSSANAMVRAFFGRGVNRSVLEERLLFEALGRTYTSLRTEEMQDAFTTAELEAFYLEHRDRYEEVSYRFYSIDIAIADLYDPDEEELLDDMPFFTREGAVTAAEEIAALAEEDGEDGFLAGVRASLDARNMADIDEDHMTIQEHLRQDLIWEGEVGEWLLSDDRAAGDVVVIEEEYRVNIVLFLSENDNRFYTSDVRHILIMPDPPTFLDEDGDLIDEEIRDAQAAEHLEIARDEANDLLARWQAVGTEEYFIDLVREYSADYRGEPDPGRYSNISHRTNFVAPFLDWTLDPTRTPGDVDIVETEHGFHIMFFVQQNDEMYQRHVLAKTDKAQEQLALWLADETLAVSAAETFFFRLTEAAGR